MHGKTMMTKTAGAALAAAALGLVSACTPPAGPVVAASDSTAPVASLSLSHILSGSALSGTLSLVTKTGPLYFSAVGQDPESGIQDVEIWFTTSSTFCDTDDLCSQSGPGLVGAPVWTSTTPKKNPGQPMSVNSVLIQWIDLATTIGQQPLSPGQSRSKTWEAWAVVKNNFGLVTTTGLVKATWSESA